MLDEKQPWLLLIPPEIRLDIYSYLFVDGGERCLAIRNKPAPPVEGRHLAPGYSKAQVHARRQSTRYNVMEQTSMFHRRCYETTYYLANSSVEIHTTILAVCRLLYIEAADVLYGKHTFDFGHHIEAVVPFLADRTRHTRQIVKSISVYKRGPMPCLGSTSDKYEWAYMCRYLANADVVKRMTVVVECGQPTKPWDGVQQLTESDVRLLSLVGHETLEWVKELAQVKNLEELNILCDEKFLPVPKSPAMAVYAALSASVDEGLKGFLRSEMIRPK